MRQEKAGDKREKQGGIYKIQSGNGNGGKSPRSPSPFTLRPTGASSHWFQGVSIVERKISEATNVHDTRHVPPGV